MSDPALIRERLERAFRRIARERMADIPILNTAVEVEAVGFTPWDKEYLGVLITPWFMNLMLVPGESTEAAAPVQSGDKENVQFPAGTFEFIQGFEDEVGAFRLCSLFSPMFEFEDHAAASATAREVLKGIMQPPEDQESETRRQAMSRRNFLRGASAAPAEQPR